LVQLVFRQLLLILIAMKWPTRMYGEVFLI